MCHHSTLIELRYHGISGSVMQTAIRMIRMAQVVFKVGGL